ncbi:LAMI_0H10770g1_1 [Lachancea mirantina]|uniref:LAMI_0H10770g1_1 n=1 Tax=Lachancea mirantina TaxID=1230905 RepID=A0A1G4KH94_9SACH|nr:LAMI_0H10770g1_1 [Lachancea mirantina]
MVPNETASLGARKRQRVEFLVAKNANMSESRGDSGMCEKKAAILGSVDPQAGGKTGIKSGEQRPLKKHKKEELAAKIAVDVKDATRPGGMAFPLMSGRELEVLYERQRARALPSCDEAFPWLHGYSEPGCAPPLGDMLITVRSQPPGASDVENSGMLVSSLDPHEFLMGWNPQKQEMEAVVAAAAQVTALNAQEASVLNAACAHFRVLPHLMSDKRAQAMYGHGSSHRVRQSRSQQQPWKEPGMFRRFDLQVAKMVEMASDCVIYCFDALLHPHACRCRQLALVILVALRCIRAHENVTSVPAVLASTAIDSRWIATPLMKVSSLCKTSPEQLASKFDVASFNNWDRDLFYRERLEISKMSSTTCVDTVGAVWCGNSTDHEIYRVRAKDSSQRQEMHASSFKTPSHFCPTNTIVTVPPLDYNRTDFRVNDSLLFNIPTPNRTWSLFVHCTETSALPELVLLQQMISKIHIGHAIPHTILPFPSSGCIGLGNLNLESIKIILHMCYLLYAVGKKTNNGSLLYCTDGYTETSFLLVAYLIFAWSMPLEDTIIRLHREVERPFFLFPVDLQVLEHLQYLLLEKSPLKDEATTDMLEVSQELFGKMFFLKPKDTFNLVQLKGPLPSRILPHLYLGSLEHAQNSSLLKELGIKHIVSVGETMPWLVAAVSRRRSYTVSELETRKNVGTHRPRVVSRLSMTSISETATAKSLLPEETEFEVIEEGGFRIFHIKKIYDNGEDQLLSQLQSALEFIDDCYRKNEKVLVHCMVGVSRSATVCIAECMRRLHCDVLRAYLYVRVRRLNIIIQPNLMFMYELCKWQELQGQERQIDWHILCRSISELNNNYL